ncbi:MAG: squalene synthase HpnC [Deltaproteobacteria bacterium]|nr:squalene synthase HpnC [Deltaproteobacteria bacterium]
MIPWSFTGDLPLAGVWSLEESERYCLRMASSHYENFPVVMRVFDEQVRRSLGAIYAFARTADDFADEQRFEGVRLELLDVWAKQLEECFAGRPRHPVFIALAAAAERHGLEARPFRDLLSAFRQDCVKNRYGHMDELHDYCSRSANPVGRLVLRVMGQESRRAIELSDRTCTALQLANFWQDLSVDIPRGRLYVPLEAAARWGLTETDLRRRRRTGGWDGLVHELVGEARSLMQSARALPLAVNLTGAFYLEAVQRGGLRILDEVDRLGGKAAFRRPKLRKRDAASIFMRTSAATLTTAPLRLAAVHRMV